MSNDLIPYTDPADIHYQDISIPGYKAPVVNAVLRLQPAESFEPEESLDISEESLDIFEGLEAYQAAQRQKANEPFQQILSWINRAREDIEKVTESDVPGCLVSCLDDIEKLCKEQVK